METNGVAVSTSVVLDRTMGDVGGSQERGEIV